MIFGSVNVCIVPNNLDRTLYYNPVTMFLNLRHVTFVNDYCLAFGIIFSISISINLATLASLMLKTRKIIGQWG